MNQHTHVTTRQLWIDRIERFDQAEQTVAQFCAAQGCSQASFYKWRRRLQDPDPVESSLAKFVPVKVAERPTDHPPSPTTVMSVELPGGTCVRLEVIHASQVQS